MVLLLIQLLIHMLSWLTFFVPIIAKCEIC